MRENVSKAVVEKLIGTLHEFRDCTVSEVENGSSTDVFGLTNHEDQYYLRIAPEGENISTEAAIHGLARQAGVRVPDCKYYEDFNSLLNRSFMVTSTIPGHPLTDSQGGNSEIISSAGEDLALLHSIKCNGFGWFDVTTPHGNELIGAFNTYSEFIFDGIKILDRLSFLKEKEILNKEVSDSVREYIVKNRNGLDSGTAVLSHCDLNNEHIFCSENSYSGLIDFGDASAMSVYHDLAKYSLNEPKDYRSLLQGYLKINPLQKNYQDTIKLEAVIAAVKILFWKATKAPHLLKSNMNYFDILQNGVGN